MICRVVLSFAIVLIGTLCSSFAHADISLSAIFSDHMVLQREQANRVWGWGDAGEEVSLSIAGQQHTSTTDESGRWEIMLDKLAAGGPHEMIVAGNNSLKISDILVGEVWLCSGQSNMEWPVGAAYDGDLETLIATDSKIRLITVPRAGSQEPQNNFKGAWQECSPKSVRDFSAVGYYFGKQIAQTLDVPVGLIDNSWGGSACEAWIERKLLSEDDRFRKMHQFWLQLEDAYDYDAKLAEYNELLKTWKAGDKTTPRPYTPENMLYSKNRPANLYNGMLSPLIGYGMRGVIWYQGETNAERGYQYRELFPVMVESWRKDWQIGDFPFYWVQLADFMAEASEPSESNWAELREAQSMALDKLPNVGQAITIDLGETDDIHPSNKRDVALRLARLALAQDYGVDVPHLSPRYKSMHVADGKIIISFETGKHPDGELKAFDKNELMGFTIAGEDRKFVPAQAKIITPHQVEVVSNKVTQPVAVRYAWANNPVCNLKNRAGLPASPFRTDDWPGITMKSY